MATPDLVAFFESESENQDWGEGDDTAIEEALKKICDAGAEKSKQRGRDDETVNARRDQLRRQIEDSGFRDTVLGLSDKIRGLADIGRAKKDSANIRAEEIGAIRKSIQSSAHKDKDEALANINVQEAIQKQIKTIRQIEELQPDLAKSSHPQKGALENILSSRKTFRQTTSLEELESARSELKKTRVGRSILGGFKGGGGRGAKALRQLFESD